MITLPDIDRLVTKVMNRIMTLLGTDPNASMNIIRFGKLAQNVKITALNLLGKSLDPSKEELFVKKVAEAYLDSFPKRGENVGIHAAQSLTQPITQATLKAQHSAGQKSSSDETAFVKLNALKTCPRIITLHARQVGNEAMHERLSAWAKAHEYVSFGEVIATPYGRCKYVPKAHNECLQRDKYAVYIDVPKVCEVFYVFKMDPSKLHDVGLTPLELYDIVKTFDGLGLVIHPVQTFTFELCPSGIDQATFDERIKLLLKTRLKGLEGVENIEVKSLEAKDAIKFTHREDNKTFLFCSPEVLFFFPRDELLKRVGGKGTWQDNPLALVVEGSVVPNKEPYHYLAVKGSMTLATMLAYTTKPSPLLFRRELITTNDPIEMVDFLGMVVAQSVHEMNYSISLVANKFTLSYAHINILCAKMFGYGLNPMSPQGFENIDGITSLDKLAYQNYAKHLSMEPVKETKRFPVRSIITSAILGKPYAFGTNYASARVNTKAKQETIRLCSEAKTKQYYGDARFKDIDFYGFGTVQKVRSGLARTIPLTEERDFDY